MKLGVDYRALLPGKVADQFDKWTGIITAAWNVEHRDDGGHTWHRVGEGSPEGVVLAPRGALFSRKDGGAATCLYVKETGGALKNGSDWTTTGWAAK